MARQLGKVCTFYTGTGFPIEYQGKTEGKYPFYKVGDISKCVLSGNNELGLCDNYIDEDDVRALHGTILPAGTIVFAKIGEAVKLNRRAITTCDCLVDNNVMGIKPNQAILTLQYCFHFLCKTKMEDYAVSTTVPSVKKSVLEKIEIEILSIDEQNRVCSEIGKTNELISLRKKQLQKLDDLVKSRFVEMFGDPVTNPKGWEKHSLSDEAEIKIGPFGSLLHKDDYISGGHALVNPSHIVDGAIIPAEDLTVSDEKYKELNAYHLLEGDVVMGRRGEMGRCAVVDRSGLLCGTGSLLIRSKGDLSADFIQKVISFPTFKKSIEEMAVGQTMPNLNVPIVSSFQFIKPPKRVQDDYYFLVATKDEIRLTVQRGLDKLELLKQSLMQKYFG